MDTRTDTSAASASSVAPSRRGLSSFALKIAAIVGMTLNHACYLFYPHLPVEARCVLFGVGGLTFPIMAFLLVEGYRRTSSVERYAGRMLVFALVAQVPYGLFLAHNLNVLFTLSIGLAILHARDRMRNRAKFWLFAAALTAASALCDWGVIGPLMILMMQEIPERRQRIVLPLLVPILGTGLPALSDYTASFDPALLPFALYPLVGCTTAIPLLLAYNGSRGRPMKWFFYAYYPLHILALGLAKGVLLGEWGPGL
ncbi:conjugal transfer protein TraX [Gordonibacter sp. An230]|uniref:TraX family protein n=1 Tax=Gordonibacter sp. An230 TaxID=1965592 RepID=UPI000B37C88E|nr:TraX family protein [Gordonibacter sp. An230]OUO91018.1 conjugal transfer protein TraX [Gordonibacter sp. An230]